MHLNIRYSFLTTFSLRYTFAILALCASSTQQHSIIIIGAGPAGLAAATRLLSHHLTDVLVLEAENRIGGRVNSVPFGDATVELGAEWCHGETGNVVYEMVKGLDMLEAYVPELDVFFFNGKYMDRNQSGELLEMFMQVSHTIDGTQDKNVTTGDAFIKAFKEAVQNMYLDNSQMYEMAMESLSLMEKYILGLDSSFSWYDSSAYKSYQECPGNQGLTWKGQGFNQIFDVMSNMISKDTEIRSLVGKVTQFNKVVSKIEYGTDKGIVTCTDDSQFSADFIIFTPSLGVLKHDHEDLFHPNLQEEKIQAIEDLGIGAVMKIVLHYNSIWWPSDLGSLGYNFVFTKEDEKEIANSLFDDPVQDGKSWLTSILGFLPAERNPNVLSFWLVGPLVPAIEEMPDEQIKAGINYVLSKCLAKRHVNITKPDKMIRSRWFTNPHFRGSYSYETIKSYRDGAGVHAILAQPEKNADGKEVLFFAGEATHSKYYSTVHGAIETGRREADRILKQILNS